MSSTLPQTMLLYAAQGLPPRGGSGIDPNFAAALLALYAINKNG